MAAISEPITFDTAYKLACLAAKSKFGAYLPDQCSDVLSKNSMEAEGCWLFFKNENLAIPADRPFSDCAFVVSKSGDVTTIVDFMPNEEMMKDYLKAISLHRLGNLEAAIAAIKEFNKRYNWHFLTD